MFFRGFARITLFLCLSIAFGISFSTSVLQAQELPTSRYRDPVTNAEIVDMTGPMGTALTLYYHFSNLTADERYVIFAAGHGKDQKDQAVYAHEMATGKTRRLTNDPRIWARKVSPHPRDPDVILAVRGNELLKLRVSTGAIESIGRVPGADHVELNQPTVNGAGTHAAVGFPRDEKTWEIGRFDLRTGEYSTVIRQGFRIGHVQYHPSREEIFYVWETGGYAPQRSWLVKSDGTGNRPFYASIKSSEWVTPDKEWMTHEAWVRDTGNMTMIMDKQGVVLVQPDGKWRFLFHGRYWHAHARADGKVLVIDDSQGRIWLGNAETGDIRLVVSNYWRKSRAAHAHASLSASGRYLVFNDGQRHQAVSYIDLSKLDLPAWFRP